MSALNKLSLTKLVMDRITEIATSKGAKLPAVNADTVLLGGTLPIDSLDLATIVVQLEATANADPFRDGFVEFRTIGELATLFANASN